MDLGIEKHRLSMPRWSLDDPRIKNRFLDTQNCSTDTHISTNFLHGHLTTQPSNTATEPPSNLATKLPSHTTIQPPNHPATKLSRHGDGLGGCAKRKNYAVATLKLPAFFFFLLSAM